MNKITKLLPVLVLSTSLAAPAGLADQGQFYLAPGAQWMDFDNGLNLGEDVGYFIGLGYDFTDRLSAEVSSFDLDPGTDFDIDHWKVDVLYDLNGGDRRVNTFVVSGLGNSNFSGDNDSVWDFGGGINVKLTENLSWRTAVRNYMYLGRDHEDSDVGVDSALVYRFGGNKRPRPVAAAPAPAPAPVAAPVVADADQDGVPDSRDRCPDTPRNYAVDADGCPIAVEEVARVELKVNFDLDQSVVKAEFFSEIEAVAQFMRQYPDVIVELEGHTDSTGADDYNLGLSNRRANAVRQVLIDRYSVQASRITARGFGESQPIASNATPAGRAQNRRVMTVIIKTLQNYRPR